MVILDPEILVARDERRDDDGCLIFPGLHGVTVRPHHLVVRGLDEEGTRTEWTFDGLDAVVAHHEIDHLTAAVRAKVEAAGRAGERVDQLAFVPDGEPTLDSDLGRTIEARRPLGIPIAVISHGTLVDRRDVRAELAEAASSMAMKSATGG
jgi:hypothetical protein